MVAGDFSSDTNRYDTIRSTVLSEPQMIIPASSLDKLKAERDEARHLLQCAVEDGLQFLAERDEALCLLDQYKEYVSHSDESFEEIVAERDEAREWARKIRNVVILQEREIELLEWERDELLELYKVKSKRAVENAQKVREAGLEIMDRYAWTRQGSEVGEAIGDE